MKTGGYESSVYRRVSQLLCEAHVIKTTSFETSDELQASVP